MSRQLTQRLVFTLITIAAIATVTPIVLVVGYIAAQGLPAISAEFITGLPRSGMREGGIWPAIVGTVYLT
ncbi:MAG: phosphate ABC transporter permease PstA, partial [Anaerolineales bacterium]